MRKLIDFTHLEVYPYRMYGGANGNKRCMVIDGDLYMVKIFNPMNHNVRYGGAFSEHISSTISNMIGIPAQETILGFYMEGGVSFPAVACRDFCDKNEKLHEFSAVKNWVIDSSNNGSGKDLYSVLAAIDSQTLVDPVELKRRFWDIFILDALIGNFDRHPGNFGIIVNEVESSARIAPVYDCGSSLFPLAIANETLIKIFLTDEKEQFARVYDYPLHSLTDENGEKLNYHDFLYQGRNRDCIEALLRVTPNIDLERITGFIRDIKGLSELVKDFYCKVLELRKSLILDQCYEKFQQAGFEKGFSSTPIEQEMFRRERRLLDGPLDGLPDVQRQFIELFREELRSRGKNDLRHIFNSDIEIKVVAKLLKDKGFHKKEVSDAVRALSPKAMTNPKYIDKVMVKAKNSLIKESTL